MTKYIKLEASVAERVILLSISLEYFKRNFEYAQGKKKSTIVILFLSPFFLIKTFRQAKLNNQSSSLVNYAQNNITFIVALAPFL